MQPQCAISSASADPTAVAPALRLATRGSRQAWAQSSAIADLIRRTADREVELVRVETTGDQRSDVPLHTIGGQGVFVKEVQRAVLDGRADLAVHSAKDLPTEPAEGLTIAAFTARRDARDALIGCRLDDLADGATVATGSVRRRAQLAAIRPDLEFRELRGNIDTRLERIPDGGAIVMAVAALQILDLTDRIDQMLPVERFVPAVGQGCVAVEVRADDAATTGAVGEVDDAVTRAQVEVERAYLAELGSGCSLPVGAHVSGGVLHTFLADPASGRIASERLVVGIDSQTADVEQARSAARRARSEVG